MKKVLLSMIVALAFTTVASAQTEGFKKDPSFNAIKLEKPAATPKRISTAVGEQWWGYVQDNTYRTGLGTGATGVVDQAILVSKDNAAVAGKTIKAVRFYLRDLSTISDVKLWISTTLPSSADNANILVQELASDNLTGGDDGDYYCGKVNEVELTTPYTMGDADVYIGYSYNVTSVTTSAGQYPIVLSYEDGVEGSLFLHTASIPWGAYESYGPLDIRLKVEGEFAGNAVTPSDFGTLYAKVGESVPATVTLTSAGTNAVNSIDYTITTDGVAGAEQHVDLTTPITFGTTGTVKITIPAEATQSVKEKTLTVTKVNGAANDVSDKDAAFTLYSLSEIIDRNVVVEEYTGTGCGWCPRGLVGMQKLRSTFGDRFVGIGLHQFNSSDAMYISPANYAALSFSGAPSCMINRGEEMDPYYGTGNDICDDFRAEMSIPAVASVMVSGQLDADFTSVDATATVGTIFDANYSLEFVVIGDQLTGSGTAWNQSNYYYQYSASRVPADLQQFASGGKYGSSSITGWVFDDVALVSSYKNRTNQADALALQAGESKEVSYTLTLPTKTTLKNALNKDELYVIALVVNDEGRIVNAAKAKVDASATGISTVTTRDSNTARGSYTLDGRQATATQRGIVIERMADGTVRKVVR